MRRLNAMNYANEIPPQLVRLFGATSKPETQRSHNRPITRPCHSLKHSPPMRVATGFHSAATVMIGFGIHAKLLCGTNNCTHAPRIFGPHTSPNPSISFGNCANLRLPPRDADKFLSPISYKPLLSPVIECAALRFAHSSLGHPMPVRLASPVLDLVFTRT